MPSTFLDTLNTVSSITQSDSFKTSSDFLKSVTGFNNVIQAGQLSKTAYEVGLQGVANSTASSLEAYTFNNKVATQNLINNLNGIRANRDAIVSEQRAQVASRGISGSRTALAFINETLSRAERVALDYRIVENNRQEAAEFNLRSRLQDLQTSQNSLKLQRKQDRKRSTLDRFAAAGQLAGAIGPAANAISGLFG